MTEKKNLLINRLRWIVAFVVSLFIFGIFVKTDNIKAVKYDNIYAESNVCVFSKLTDSVKSSLPFVNTSLCLINDSTNSMQSFINELGKLLNGKDTVINIIHLGDSHIEAGFLSGQTMRMLQHSFGNAGRGWVAPFKLAKGNEPSDYFILSNVKNWTAGKCIQKTPKCPWGVGGIGIQTNSHNIGFDLIVAPVNGSGYEFNKAMLFRDKNAMPMAPAGNSKDSVLNFVLGNAPCEDVLVDTFLLSKAVDTLSMKSIGYSSNEVKSSNSLSSRYYGFVLTNGQSGILYHAIGVNGATYKSYTNRDYIRQLSLLKPSLLIVSLGTNESFGGRFNNDVFRNQLDAFVSIVREELPGTTLLLTTPIESYKRVRRKKKRTYIYNENIPKISDVILKYTHDNNIASLDMYSIAGGKNACAKWYKAGMFGRDRVHFTQTGYAEQGMLLYKSIVNTCIADSGLSKSENTAVAVNEKEAHDVK